MQEITCASTQFHVEDTFWHRVRGIYSGINKNELESVLVTQEINACSAASEMQKLLQCDLFGRNAHAFVKNAVVSGEKNVMRLAQLRI